jgi:predicted dinucleotide-binding enzyme
MRSPSTTCWQAARLFAEPSIDNIGRGFINESDNRYVRPREENRMKIGVLGPGRVGAALGNLWALSGHEVVVGGSRNAAKAEAVAQWIGGTAKAASPEEVVQRCDIVLFAIPWWTAAGTLATVGNLAGKTVVDAMNPYAPGFAGRDAAFPETATVAEWLAERLPEARIVKAFNTIPDAALTFELQHRGVSAGGDLRQPDANNIDGAPSRGTWPCLVAGDDETSLLLVEPLVRNAGFVPLRAGALRRSVLFELGGPLYGHRLGVDALRQRLEEL